MSGTAVCNASILYREVAAPPKQGTNKEKLEDLQTFFHKSLLEEIASLTYSDYICNIVIPEGNKMSDRLFREFRSNTNCTIKFNAFSISNPWMQSQGTKNGASSK